jgi:type VI secretion system secreted protein Hcp
MKTTDSSSPVLFQKCCDGSVIPFASVTLQRRVSGVATPYLVYTFGNVYITSVQWSGTGGSGDSPMESLAFCFEEVTVDYTPQKDDGTAGTAIHGGWDVGQNVKA